MDRRKNPTVWWGYAFPRFIRPDVSPHPALIIPNRGSQRRGVFVKNSHQNRGEVAFEIKMATSVN